MTRTFHTLTSNAGGLVRKARRNGRPHLIAPGVLITHGVHEGSGGPIYYPEDELSKASTAWNNIPIVLSHPKDEAGKPVTVNTQGVLDSSGMGILDNQEFSGGKQKAEHYFDVEKTRKVNESVLTALFASKPFEISTGMSMDVDQTPGEHEGKPYVGIARNIIPDHLAVLVNEQGACSVKDGCGCLVVNEASFQRIHYAVSNALENKHGYYCYVRDVYSDFFVYSDKAGALYKQAYSMSGDKAALSGDPEQVKWITEYQTADGQFVGNCSCSVLKDKEIDVDKAQMIAALIGNGQGAWTEADRKTLESFPDDKLKKLMPEAPKPAPILLEVKPPVVANAAKPVSLDTYIGAAPVELQGMLRQMVANEKAAKAQLVANIQASPRNQFTPEFLNTLPVEQLQGMAALASSAGDQVDYAPAGGVKILNNSVGGMDLGDPLVPPDVLLAAGK